MIKDELYDLFDDSKFDRRFDSEREYFEIIKNFMNLRKVEYKTTLYQALVMNGYTIYHVVICCIEDGELKLFEFTINISNSYQSEEKTSKLERLSNYLKRRKGII